MENSFFSFRARSGFYIVLILACLGLAAKFYWITKMQDENTALLQTQLLNTQSSLSEAQAQTKILNSQLLVESNKSFAYSNQLNQVSSTAEMLQRQVNTDPQLLQKYSKIFFLNENYSPSALTDIDTRFLFVKTKPIQFHDRVWPFLMNLLTDANNSGVNLLVDSGYRSFGTQATLKSTYKVTYGAGTANSFSADQGYSEHQLGTALDFTTQKIGGGLAGFEKTDAYMWLNDNAYKYGFILSYPSSNSYYIFEPWHWRFVGLDLALRLHNENKHFYDLDQRDINPYLANFFNASLSSTLTH